MKTWGFRGALGYASDKPFKEMAYSLVVSYAFPSSNQGSWLLSLAMGNNTPLFNNIPIPGLAYVYRSEKFIGVIGLPLLSMRWTPTDLWGVSVSALGANIQTEIAYGRLTRLQVFGGFSSTQQFYMPSDREKKRYRLSLQEQKLTTGARLLLFKHLLSELQVGRSLGRQIYLGNGLFNRDGGSESLGSGWFANWSIKYAL